MSDPLKIERRGRVLEVTIDRPKANAIDAATSRLMGDVFKDFRDDPNLRVAILTGQGEKFFCPGWDLKSVADGAAADDDFGVGGFGGMIELPNLNKPVICAINGIAFGGGFEIAMACDILVAAEHATFSTPEINVGVLADFAAVALRRRIPHHVAVEFLMTGRRMDTTEAKHWGLINEVVAGDQLMTRAREIADLLADGPPLVFAAIKDVMRRTETMGEQTAVEAVRGLHSAQYLYASEDMHEGATAFAEKRTPVWKGK